MIRVTYGQRPPCIVLHLASDREPFIIYDEKTATMFATDLCHALNKAFPSPLTKTYAKHEERDGV